MEMKQVREMEHNQGNGAASLKWSIIRKMQQVPKMDQIQGNEAGQGNGAELGKCSRAGKWSSLREMPQGPAAFP